MRNLKDYRFNRVLLGAVVKYCANQREPGCRWSDRAQKVETQRRTGLEMPTIRIGNATTREGYSVFVDN